MSPHWAVNELTVVVAFLALMRWRVPSALTSSVSIVSLASHLVGPMDKATTRPPTGNQIRPVVLNGAEAMDRIFPEG
jgi:hypothetical protein